MKCLLLLLFLTACSTTPERPRQTKSVFSYTDVSGEYFLEREHKRVKNKLVTRNILKVSGSTKTLEKSITVSQMGTTKSKDGRVLTLRPLASEFVVWLEGQKYSSKMRLNTKKKVMTVVMDSPEAKWQGTKEIPFPTGKYFCFYSQLADCLYYNQFLERAQKQGKSLGFFIVWDSWPYIQDQLSGTGKNLFSTAFLRFEGKERKNLRFIIDVDGQIILYHFSKSLDLVKIAWIAQGITVIPPEQKIPSEDQ